MERHGKQVLVKVVLVPMEMSLVRLRSVLLSLVQILMSPAEPVVLFVVLEQLLKKEMISFHQFSFFFFPAFSLSL